MRRNVTRATTVATGAAALETVIGTITTPSLADNPLVQGVTIQANVNNLAPGTSTTGCILKIRKGASGIAGAQVGVNKAVAIAAAATGSDSIKAYDPAPVAGQSYVITLTQTAGAAAGSIAELIMECVSG